MANLILFCDICGEMKKITYKYISTDLNINCHCLKDNKKGSYEIKLFLNNDYKSNPKLICDSHKKQFTHWCNDCRNNFCDDCLSKHSGHNVKKLSSLLLNTKDINSFQEKVKNFQKKLDEIKKKIEDKKLFNNKEDAEYLNIFKRYYELNCHQRTFADIITQMYLSLVSKNQICYQIIINLKYLMDKLNYDALNNFSVETKNDKNTEGGDDLLEIYYILFNPQQYCLLLHNEKEEVEKEVEELKKSIILERTVIFNDDMLDFIEYKSADYAELCEA